MHLHMVLDNLLPCTIMRHLILPEPPYHYLLKFRLLLVELYKYLWFWIKFVELLFMEMNWINWDELTNYLKIAFS